MNNTSCQKKKPWVFLCLSVSQEGLLDSLHDNPNRESCPLSFFLDPFLVVCPDRAVEQSGWGSTDILYLQTLLLHSAAFTAVQRGPAKVPLQLPYTADWWVPKSPYFSQGFSFSTFSVWLHEGWHWIGTAESVLHHFKQGQSLWLTDLPIPQ